MRVHNDKGRSISADKLYTSVFGWRCILGQSGLEIADSVVRILLLASLGVSSCNQTNNTLNQAYDFDVFKFCTIL